MKDDLRDKGNLIGPWCFRCGADTKGDPATYIPHKNGPLYTCHGCHTPASKEER